MPRLAPQGTFPALREPDGAGAASACSIPRRSAPRSAASSTASSAAWAFPPTTSTGISTCTCCRASGARCSETVARALPGRPPLIRDPIRPAGRHPVPAHRRGQGARRSARWRSGFAQAARKRGLPTNDSFAGFSRFDEREPYAEELEQALRRPGRRHHRHVPPGPSRRRACRASIPSSTRRRMEYEALMANPACRRASGAPRARGDGATASTGRSADPDA